MTPVTPVIPLISSTIATRTYKARLSLKKSSETTKAGTQKAVVFNNSKKRVARQKKIDVELIQSYAPCHECAKEITKYKKEMQEMGKEVSCFHQGKICKLLLLD